MKILLDTHVFLWYIGSNPRLSPDVAAAIADRTNEIYLSIASVWEVVIKHSSGKLEMDVPPEDFLPAARTLNGFESLLIDEATMPALASLPHLHRDPFDRILVAQAIQHGMTLATDDMFIRAYNVSILP